MGKIEPPPPPKAARRAFRIGPGGLLAGIAIVGAVGLGIRKALQPVAPHPRPGYLLERIRPRVVVVQVPATSVTAAPKRETPEPGPEAESPVQTPTPAPAEPTPPTSVPAPQTPEPAPQITPAASPKPKHEETIGEAIRRCISLTGQQAGASMSMSDTPGGSSYSVADVEIRAHNRCEMDLPGDLVHYVAYARSGNGGIVSSNSGFLTNVVPAGGTSETHINMRIANGYARFDIRVLP